MHFFDIAVPETDDWEAWLAYADLLIGAGDLRGEAIRLEHRCESGDGDQAQLAAVYEEVERRLGLDGLREDGSWQFTSDIFGCPCSLDQLDELDAFQFPNLKELDLSQADFNATSYELFSALADSSVLPQLEQLSIGNLTIDQADCEGDPLATLAELAPRFAHLDLHVDDVIDIEGADEEEVDRVLSRFGLSQALR
ncbi:hypothetical protein [Streptosporangium sp. NPDC001681]|uniref:hypothetical protein n=1 Tax=Streptosporangium sp. NPDC001681 TaxID=3154395 RepID=UPI00332305F5